MYIQIIMAYYQYLLNNYYLLNSLINFVIYLCVSRIENILIHIIVTKIIIAVNREALFLFILNIITFQLNIITHFI